MKVIIVGAGTTADQQQIFIKRLIFKFMDLLEIKKKIKLKGKNI